MYVYLYITLYNLIYTIYDVNILKYFLFFIELLFYLNKRKEVQFSFKSLQFYSNTNNGYSNGT